MNFCRRVNIISSLFMFISFITSFIYIIVLGRKLIFMNGLNIDTLSDILNTLVTIFGSVFTIILVIGIAVMFEFAFLSFIGSLFSIKYNKLYNTTKELIYLRKSLKAKGVVLIVFLLTGCFIGVSAVISILVGFDLLFSILNILSIALTILVLIAYFKVRKMLKLINNN